MQLEKYSITVGKYRELKAYNKSIRRRSFYKDKEKSDNGEKIEIVYQIEYYDNLSNKVEDLKEYICNLLNYSFCPCLLKIFNGKDNFSKYLYFRDLEYIKYESTSFLSKIGLKKSFFVIIMLDNKCQCSPQFKSNFKLTKTEILNTFIKEYEELTLNKNKLSDEINDKNSTIEHSKKKIEENENTIKDLLNQNEEIIKENKKFNKEIRDKKDSINELNKKDDFIQKLQIENKEFKNSLTKNFEEINEKKNLIENLKLEKEKNKNDIYELKKKIKEFESITSTQNNKINELINKEKKEEESLISLQKQLNEKSQIIIDLQKERDNFKKNYETLEDNYKLKGENENNLNEKLNEIENNNLKEKEELEKKITELQEENSMLTFAVSKNVENLEKLHELGLLKNININENSDIIKINPDTNQIIPNNNIKDIQKYDELENFYDVIVNIKSVKDIAEGWEIKMTKKGEENFEKYKNEELIKIGVIGNSNKGKSFILSKISRIDLPSGTSIKTEGLSIKYPELKILKNNKIVLLDSAGLETPVLNEKSKEIEENKEAKAIKNVDNKENSEKKEDNNIANNNINNDEISKKNNDKKDSREIFKEKSREKLITELFLQNYIINNSDILIIVVGIMTYSEQKLLNRIKIEIQKLKINRPLYIIHNLKTFYTEKQVKYYIDNYLKKSATFDLIEGHKINPNVEIKTGTYFYEKKSSPQIFHLLFANEGSEAGKIYNNFTIEFLEKDYQRVTDLKPFDVFETIKERFISLSTEIIELNKESKLFKKEDINDNKDIINNKIIKLKTPQQIKLKKCLIDELGFSNLKGNGFQPNYNYFKKDNKIIVRVESPGNSTIISNIEYSEGYIILRLSGIKNPDKEPKDGFNIFSSREFGSFNLDIFLKAEDYVIENNPEIKEVKGLIILTYACKLRSKPVVFNGNENEEEI